MPPVVHSSDESDSDGTDVIMPRKVEKQPAAEESEDEVEAQASEEEEGEEEEEEEDGDGEEYIVEAIMDHRFDRNNLFFHVKWQDYPHKKDWTWEPEDHLTGGSDAILQEYYNKIGGRPVQKSPSRGASAARKRARNSTSAAATPAKSSKKSRVSASAKSVDVDSPSEARWEPPTGSWEEHITHIDTIERNDNGLVCYLQWQNGKKTQHDIHTVHQKCPQRMLSFYEQHLVFKETGSLS